jgi:hypothetical protein
MNETKIELTHRLQREGRWGEASVLREKLRRELREAGKTRAVANDEAWSRMADEFPPLSASHQQSEGEGDPLADGDDGDLPENLPVGSATFKEDLLWAYHNITSAVTETTAPSGSAWYLREWGRNPRARDKFVTLVMKTFGQKTDTDEQFKDDRRRQFALLENITKEFAGIEQHCPLCNGTYRSE